jgi:hypothetical protein
MQDGGGERMNNNGQAIDQKKIQLFLEQKRTLDIFLSNGAISQAQYNKSYGDLVKLMGMEAIAKEIEREEKK